MINEVICIVIVSINIGIFIFNLAKNNGRFWGFDAFSLICMILALIPLSVSLAQKH
jgi:DMSO/TMAO reductase YedYZ heme-binding membrane subunit